MFLTGYFCHPLREASGMVSARTLSNLRLRSMWSDGIGNKSIAAGGDRFVGTSTGPRFAFSALLLVECWWCHFPRIDPSALDSRYRWSVCNRAPKHQRVLSFNWSWDRSAIF